MTWLRRYGVVVLLLVLAFGRMVASQHYKAPTMDEPNHVARGLAYIRSGRLMWIGHPPLAHVLMAAPLMLAPDALPAPGTLEQLDDFRLQGQAFLQSVLPNWRAAFLVARWPNMLLLVLLLSVLAAWTRSLFGQRAGAAVLFLAAFDPNLLAHAQLATTDVPVTAFGAAAGYLAWRLRRSGKWRDAAGLGICMGLALASKFTAIAVIGLVVLWFLWDSRARARSIGLLLGALAVAFLVLWGVYGFRVGPLLPGGPPVPAPDFARELIWQIALNEPSHVAFLAGKLYPSGSPAYFPLAFVLKTPTAIVALLVIGVLAWIRSRRGQALGLPALVVLGYFLFTLAWPLNIGYRHLLPLLPFVYVLIGLGVWHALRQARLGFGSAPSKTPGLRRLAIHGLIGWTAASSLAAFPNDLAYFAEWSGGSDNGYRWLVDSNLDWGQDLAALPAVLRSESGPIFLSYFGPTDPRAFGLDAHLLPSWDRPEVTGFYPADPTPGLYLISATNLQGVLLDDPDAFDFFRRRVPDGQIGGSILVYRLDPPRVRAEWAAVCDGPTFQLSADSVRQLLGPVKRIVYFDCAQSWVIPVAGPAAVSSVPGRYVVPPQALMALPEWAGQTQLVYAAASLVEVHTYAAHGFELPASEPITFGGALDFLGARLTGPAEITTAWRVAGPAPELALSIFSHRLSPAGDFIEAADGLGVPVAAWQMGDILLQRHRFSSALASSEMIAIGVYNWQTGRRLPSSGGDDQIILPLSRAL